MATSYKTISTKVEDYEFSKPVQSSRGRGRNVYVNTKDGKPFMVQFSVNMDDSCLVFVPEPYDDNQVGGRRTMLVNGENGRAEFAQAFDEMLLKATSEHCEEWFGRKISPEALKDLMSGVTAVSRDKEKYPIDSIKVKYDPGRTEILTTTGNKDENGNLEVERGGSFEDLGKSFRGILAVSGFMWFQSAKFGFSMTVDTIIAYPRNATIAPEEKFNFGVVIRDTETSKKRKVVDSLSHEEEDTKRVRVDEVQPSSSVDVM